MDNEHLAYKQQKSYYDTRWLNWVNQKRDMDEMSRAEFIVSSLEKLKSKHRLKIIDLGCGCGWITNALSEYGDVAGVDLSISAAEKLYPDLKFIQANIVTDEIEGKCDVVVSSEVIEHLSFEDQQIYVGKAYVFAYIYLKLYKLINRLLRASRQGLYLTIVARKRIPSR